MKKRWEDRFIGFGIGILAVLLVSILQSGRDTKKIVYKPIPTISIEMQQEEKEVVAEKNIPESNGFGITDNVEIPQDFVEELLIYEYIEYGIRKYNEDNQLDETYSVDIERNMLPYDTEFGMKDANAEPYKTDLAKEIIPELADNLYNFELIGQNGTIYMSIDTYSMKIYVYDTLQQILKWEWIIRPEEYEDCILLGEELIAVEKDNGKYGVVGSDGEIVFLEEYDEINKYSDKIAMVKNNGLCSYIDCEGKRITERQFQEATSFWEGKAAVKMDGRWGFINKEGELIINCQYEQVGRFSGNYVAVMRDGVWGVINQDNKIIVPYKYDEIREFKEGIAVVREGEKWGAIDTQGSVIAECQYDFLNDFCEGYAAVKKKNKWGYINKNGEVCIELKYDAASNFSEGKAAVKIENYIDGYMDAWAYIDEEDEVLIDFYPYMASEGRMEYVGKFENGLAFVSDDFYCVIDGCGNYVFDGHESEFIISSLVYNSKYDAISAYIYKDESMTEKKYGLVGLDGKMRMEPIFDYIHGIYDDYVLVSSKKGEEWKYGVIKVVE